MKLAVLSLAALLSIVSFSGCTFSSSEGKPIPEMTFAHVEPFLVDAGGVKIINKYERGQSRDVSEEMPTPPELALRRYAQNRLKGTSSSRSSFYFVVEDAYVQKHLVEPEGMFMKWTGVNDSDKYDMNVVLRLYKEDVNGKQSEHSVMTFNRSVTIPHHFSLAQKELEKLKFMELFMQDVDAAVEGTMKKRGWLKV